MLHALAMEHPQKVRTCNLIGMLKFLHMSSVGPSVWPKVTRPFPHMRWSQGTRLYGLALIKALRHSKPATYLSIRQKKMLQCGM